MFDDDIRDDDFRAELSDEQLEVLQRRASVTAAPEKPPVSLVGADRARLEQRRERK